MCGRMRKAEMKVSPDIELPEFLGPRDRHHVPSRSLGLAPTSPETSIRHTLTSVRLLTRFRWTILLAVAISLLAALLPGGYAEAQTAPSIQRVAITSDPGEDGGYGLDDEIEVGLTFSEGVSVFVGAPLTPRSPLMSEEYSARPPTPALAQARDRCSSPTPSPRGTRTPTALRWLPTA